MNNESNENAIKLLKNNDTSFGIESGVLNVAYFVPEFKSKFISFMKEVWNQNHSQINGLCHV